jgi:hypothetical protein
MKVFSFCLYGTEPNYYTGLLENIKLIREWFPEFDIFVYKGVCDPSWEIPNATVVETNREGAVNMLYRYTPLKTAEVGFVRDTDSRITERDRWCIQEFLASSYGYHMIRDHVWHKSRLMGGLFGWKKPIDISIEIPAEASYGYDEFYLGEVLYPRIVSDMIVHTNLFAFLGEHSARIKIPAKDPSDFIGNVIWNDVPRFASVPDPIERLNVLRGQDQFELIQYISDRVNPTDIPYSNRPVFFDTAYIANFYLRNVAKAQYWLSQFEFADISAHIRTNGNYLLPHLGKLVASFDVNEQPGEGEVMIYYGNFPDGHLALPCSNRIYRHVSRFFEVTHTKVLYHSSWEKVDTIYILNLEERVDRYYDTLLALVSVKAPLHRVYHYKAQKGGLPPYVGATKNHVDVLDHFCKSGAENALILEDDFVFIDDRATVWSTLEKLWASALTYDLCFLSLSKLGKREPYSEIALRSLQPCTTSSGYLVQRDTAQKLFEVADEGLRKMQETGDHHTYCIDRYWTKLPQIFCVRPKLGFQRPSYSNLLCGVSSHLD